MKSKSGRLKEANQSGGRALKAEALRRKGTHSPTAKMKPPLAPRGVRAFPKPAANEGPAPAQRYGKTSSSMLRLSQLSAKTDSPD